MSRYPGIHFPRIYPLTPSPFPPFELPAEQNFSAMEDGPLPREWIENSETFSISSGKMINTPNAEQITISDFGLEANYTGGKCDTLAALGAPTTVQSADVHQGSKAQ